MLSDIYNEKVYQLVVKEVRGLKHYPDIQLMKDNLKDLVMNRYFPSDNLDESKVEHDIEWALADALNDGCELE